MEQVLIVAKTRMGQGKVCIGGLSLRRAENVRLMLPGGSNHPATTPFGVGQVWNLNLRNIGYLKPPHIEDTMIQAQTYIHTLPSLRDTLIKCIHPWTGGLTQVFDGYLQGEGNKAFISHQGGIPSGSTGYWLPTLPLTHTPMHGKDYYAINSYVHQGQDIYHANFLIPYVGFAKPLPELPPNMLVRVSMCRWFRREENVEERCYLQISGWYV